MSEFALLICRSQTEAIGLRRHLGQMGIPCEVTRPARRERTASCGWAVRLPYGMLDDARYRMRQLGIMPCRVIPDEEERI